MTAAGNIESLMAAAVALAHENQRLMDGTTAPVKKIIDDHELVFAVWPEGGEYRSLIVKGETRLKTIAASGAPAPAGTVPFPLTAQSLSWSSILCDGPDRAFALKEVFGEKKAKAPRAKR